MAAKLPLIRSLAGLSQREPVQATPAVMCCSECDVTWRDLPGAPCWFCGEPGAIANPKRLVLD